MVLALSKGPEHPKKTCKQMFYLFIFIFCNHSWELYDHKNKTPKYHVLATTTNIGGQPNIVTWLSGGQPGIFSYF